MKLGKYILGLALIAAGLTSCDQDNVGAIYEPTVQNISFISAGQSTTTAESNITVPVAICRATTADSYTATVTMTSASDGVSLQSPQVTFAPGEGIAYANVVISGMEKGQSYSCTLALSDADKATANPDFGDPVYTTNVTVNCDYTWTYAGVGKIESEAFEDTWNFHVYHAEEADIYRCVDLYDTGCNVELVVNGSNVTVTNQKAWLYDSSYGYVYVDGSGPLVGKVASLMLEHYLPSISYSFGAYSEVITLP